MDRKIDLAAGFIRRHPERAVSILQQQPIAEVVSLLESLPRPVVLPLLNVCSYSFAAAIVSTMALEHVASLLSSMKSQLIANILRYVEQPRSRILTCLPLLQRTQVQLLLKYDELAVGAWMSLDFIPIPEGSSVAEAKLLIQQHPLDKSEPTLFLVDRQMGLKGSLHPVQLYRSDDKQLVSSLAHKCRSLPASISVFQAGENNLWDNHEVCAILDRQKHLIGVLNHATLRQRLSQSVVSTPQREQTLEKGLAHILGIYSTSLMTLLAPVNPITSVNTETSGNFDPTLNSATTSSGKKE